MTKTLEKAFVEASRLPEKEQDELGEWLLSELESERRWDELFRRSPAVLEELGLVVTDALDMGAIVDHFDPGEAAAPRHGVSSEPANPGRSAESVSRSERSSG